MSVDRRVLALGLARLADSFGNALLIVALPLYVVSAHVHGGVLALPAAVVSGVVLAAFGVFDAVIQPWAGRLSDRLGRRRVFVLVGLCVLAATNLAFLGTHTYLGLLAVRVVQGLGVGLTVTASVALINEYSTPDSRGVHFGVFNALRLVGFGVGPVVAGVLVAHGPFDVLGHAVGGFAAAFDVAAVAAGLSLVVVYALVRDPVETSAAAANDLGLTVSDGAGGLDPVFALGGATLVVALGIAFFAAIEPAINARLGQEAVGFGLEFAAFVAAFVLAQPVAGRLSDRLGRKPFVVAGLCLAAPALLAQGFVAAPWQMALTRAVQGVGAAMAFGPALALVGDYASGGDDASTLSILTMAFGLGAGVGPVVAGPLADYGFAVPFAVAAALSVLAALVVQTQVPDDRVEAA
ncbi:MFS transporter [Halarchaeum grantii]|uniref:MFS transporter n=1 Tax=Halarchaeum grantii TaxID=1193105 RepID=A0A830EWE5_9EURY|nr:MFS transporter [Halarchaeum grantii]GGL37368.1 MFS transporter [Halarchaeum grantii]